MSDFSNSFLEKLTNQRFSYRQYSKVQFAGQGIVLEQNKEPALSGGIRPFFTRAMENVPIEDASPEDDIITISRKAGIVDENTGRPLYLLLERAKNAGCRIVVADALDDEPYISSQLAPALEMTDLLRTALPCRPFLVKPNREELAALLGAGMESLDDVRAGALRVREMGARNVLVSLGPQGSLLADETGAVRYLPAPDGRVRGAVGSGDSMVAGFLAGWLDRHDYAWAQRMGTAAGSATAFSDGLAGSARVQEVLRTMDEAALSPQE